MINWCELLWSPVGNICWMPSVSEAWSCVWPVNNSTHRGLPAEQEPSASSLLLITYALFYWNKTFPTRTSRTRDATNNVIIPSVHLSVRQSVRLSVCSASRVCSVAPTVLVWSISYLHTLPSNFRRCVACKVFCKILKFEVLAFFLICNFDFVFVWLGSDVNHQYG